MILIALYDCSILVFVKFKINNSDVINFSIKSYIVA
uniref:Uncharacterized protein n=1 Tax=Geladintestivirus 2 TaxID=3233134 RepID=A0AAU8MIH8_9CAUD